MWQKIKSLLLKNKTTGQTVAKNTFWLTVSNFGGRILRAVIIVYSARVLGTAEWGIFSYAVSLVAIVTVFTDMGINSLLVRETAKSRDSENVRQQVLSTSFILKLILLAGGVFAVIFGASHFTTIAGVKAILPLITLLLVFDTFRDFGFYIVRAMEKMEWEALLYLLTNLAIVVFGFIFLHFSKTAYAFTASYVFGAALGAMATIYALRKHFRGLLSNFSKTIAKYIMSTAWPFAISAVLGMLMINTDILIIGWLRPAEDVGLYSAAQRIVQLLYLLPGILSVSLLPSFARMAAKGENERLRNTLEKIVSLLFTAAIPIVAGGIILGGEIMKLLFGSGYTGGTLSFQILLATIILDFPVGVLGTMLFAYNKQKNITVYAAIGGFSNVIIDLILIPRFGIAGSAITTFIAQFLSTAYIRHIAKKTNDFSVLPRLKKVFAATAVMLAPVIVLKILGVNVIMNIIVSSAIYFAMLALAKEPLLREIKSIILPRAASAAPESSEAAAL